MAKMTAEELEQYLSVGDDEEMIMELLRQQERADAEFDAASGKDYLMDAGRMKVANPWGAVSDMFVRGNAKKKSEKAAGDAANARAQLSQTKIRDYARSAMGQGLGGVDLNATPEVSGPSAMDLQKAIGGNGPQLGAPPPEAPPQAPPGAVGPPQPPPGPPPAAAAAAQLPPEATPPPAAPPAPIRHSPGAPGKPPTRDANNFPSLGFEEGGGKEAIMALLADLLRGNSQGPR